MAHDPNRLVLIDEAYSGFGATSAVSLINQYDNLLITRSFSKSHALAGLRVGYGLAHANLIEGLRRVKDSFNSILLTLTRNVLPPPPFQTQPDCRGVSDC